MWHLGTWFNGKHGDAALMVGLDNFRHFFPTLMILFNSTMEET